jgi:TRAP-type C4-dicarboxylate transport system permease large subunit
VIIVLVTQMGVITPPVGINVYVVSGVAPDVKLESIFKGALPFLAALIFGTAALVAVPQIVLFLPQMMY